MTPAGDLHDRHAYAALDSDRPPHRSRHRASPFARDRGAAALAAAARCTPPQRQLIRSAAAHQVAVVFGIIAATAFGMSVYGPLLVPIQAEFNVNFATLSVLVAVPSLSRVLVTPAAGYLTDRVGPRRLLGIASLAFAAGALAAASAPSFWALVGAVFGSGFAAAFIESAAVAHLVRLAPPAARGRTISRGLTGFQVGMLASPVAAGGLAVALGWRSALVMAAVAAVVAAGTALVLIRDAQPASGAGAEAPASKGRPLRVGAITGVLAFGALLWGGASTLRAVALPLYGGVTLQLDPAAVGLVLSLLSGVRAVATLAGGQLMDRHGRLVVVGTTVLMNLLSATVLLLPAHMAFLGLTAFCYAMGGLGATSPVVLLADRVPARYAGRGVAALQAASGTSALLLPLAAGALMDAAGIAALALLLAPVFAVALVVAAVVARSPAARSAAA